MIYVLDSNIVIHYLRGNEKARHMYSEAVLQGHLLIIPRAVHYEVSRGLDISAATRKFMIYNEMISPRPIGQCRVADMGEQVWGIAKDIYIELKQKGFTVGEIDILIAAFCLQHDYTLVTANTKDFANVCGLRVVNWV